MTDFTRILTRKNSLRKQCQPLSSADIEKVISDLSDILEEKVAQESRVEEEQRQKDEVIEAIQRMAAEANLDYDDLKDMLSATPKKKVEAKYRIVDEQGKEHFWSGRGRTPIVFQQYFDKHNVDKQACLIE